MKILKFLIPILISSFTYSEPFPTYFEKYEESDLKISFYDIVVEEFKILNKDLKLIPRYIMEDYLYSTEFPTEEDLNKIGQRYHLPEGLLFAMFWKESQYKCNKESEKGADGCFQFIKGTAIKMGLLTDDYDYRANPWISADAAARYLAWNFKFLNLSNPKNPENWKFAVAAYNAGPNKIKHDKGLRIPLYTETQYYVEDIIGYVLFAGNLAHRLIKSIWSYDHRMR